MTDKNLLKKLAAAFVIYAALAALIFSTPSLNGAVVFSGWKAWLSAGCIYFVVTFLTGLLAGVAKGILPGLIDTNRQSVLSEFLDGPALAVAILVVSRLAPTLITFASAGQVLVLGVLLGAVFALVECVGQAIDRRSTGQVK